MGFTSEPQRHTPAATHNEATPVSADSSTNAKVLQLKWVVSYAGVQTVV